MNVQIGYIDLGNRQKNSNTGIYRAMSWRKNMIIKDLSRNKRIKSSNKKKR